MLDFKNDAGKTIKQVHPDLNLGTLPPPVPPELLPNGTKPTSLAGALGYELLGEARAFQTYAGRGSGR